MPSPERRQVVSGGVESVIKILPESACANFLEQLTIRGRQNLRIQVPRLDLAHTAVFASVQEPKKRRLDFKRELADFI